MDLKSWQAGLCVTSTNTIIYPVNDKLINYCFCILEQFIHILSASGEGAGIHTPATYRWRQGTPMNESPAHCRTLCEHLISCSRVHQQCSEGVTTVLSTPGLELKTHHFSAQSPNTLYLALVMWYDVRKIFFAESFPLHLCPCVLKNVLGFYEGC